MPSQATNQPCMTCQMSHILTPRLVAAFYHMSVSECRSSLICPTCPAVNDGIWNGGLSELGTNGCFGLFAYTTVLGCPSTLSGRRGNIWRNHFLLLFFSTTHCTMWHKLKMPFLVPVGAKVAQHNQKQCPKFCRKLEKGEWGVCRGGKTTEGNER